MEEGRDRYYGGVGRYSGILGKIYEVWEDGFLSVSRNCVLTFLLKENHDDGFYFDVPAIGRRDNSKHSNCSSPLSSLVAQFPMHGIS